MRRPGGSDGGPAPLPPLPGAAPEGIPAGRAPRAADTRPWYDFELERRSAGLRLLTPSELSRAIVDLTGVTPKVADLPKPILARGLDNQDRAALPATERRG